METATTHSRRLDNMVDGGGVEGWRAGGGLDDGQKEGHFLPSASVALTVCLSPSPLSSCYLFSGTSGGRVFSVSEER